jgi:hypothetical protein
MKNCAPLWREADLEVKKLKAPHLRRNFCQWGCRKSAHHCGYSILRALLEADMIKKCTALWPKAHVEVNMIEHVKTFTNMVLQRRSTFGS